MKCEHLRKTPTLDQQRELFAQSAGTCLLCSASLFYNSPRSKRSKSITEFAHIFAHSDAGPRSNSELTEEQRAAPENMALLCPTCHTKVDKSPEDFPAEVLHAKKRARRIAIELIGGATEFASRKEARQAAQLLLQRNRLLFEQLGPDPIDGSMETVEKAEAWSQCVRDEIVPNNRLLVSLVLANSKLASAAELETAELLRQHTDRLEQKHRNRDVIAAAPRFPPKAESLFEGDADGVD
jgi:hypothetical protein